MGTIDKGIMGGFQGKVGNVIGSTWKGIEYMRSKAHRRKSTPTQKQLEQQQKFGLAISFVHSMTGLIAIGFGNFAVRRTAINYAIGYTLSKAITGTYPAFSISYPNVLISRGEMPNVLAPAVTGGANSLATWNWKDNSLVGSAKPTDKMLLAAYCPALNQCIYTTGSASRDALTDSLDLTSFSGKEVHTWIGAISENGQNVADSFYTGMVTVS
jgi:hypothetical protein